MPQRTSNKMLERVIGALVVCSIGYILYSIILESRSDYSIDRSTQIPLQIESIERGDYDRDRSLLELPDTPQDLFQPEIEVSVSEALSADVISESGQPNGWVIQVGSFSHSNSPR